jgi:hypothetical protein
MGSQNKRSNMEKFLSLFYNFDSQMKYIEQSFKRWVYAGCFGQNVYSRAALLQQAMQSCSTDSSAEVVLQDCSA